MAKFKVGDKVKLKRTGEVGTVFRISTNFGFTNYWVKGLPGGPTNSPVYAEELLTLANSRVCNSVRGNTKLKDIDYWFADNGYGDDTLSWYVQPYKKDRCIDFVDRYADTAARDKFYDAMYKLTGIKNRWAMNSRACNSTNQVVRKAMNPVAMNSVDAKDKEEMAKFFKEMTDAISKISWLDMEFESYKKWLLNKAEKTQDKELADWVQKAVFEWKKIKAKAMNAVRNNQCGSLRKAIDAI